MHLEKPVYITSEAQVVLNIGKSTLLALLHSGQLRAVRVGRKWLIPRDAILEFLGGQHTPSAGGLQ